MNEISKKELRKIWTIYTLLYGEMYQQDVIVDLNCIANDINEKAIEYLENELIQEYDPKEFESPYINYHPYKQDKYESLYDIYEPYEDKFDELFDDYEHNEKKKRDEEEFWEAFWSEKNYKIDFDELNNCFEMGREGDVSGIEEILYEIESLEPDELNELDLDEWSSEIGSLVELRNLYNNKSKKITDPMVSTTLRELRELGIIESVPSKKEGRGPSPNKHYLKQDINALHKILIELRRSKLDIYSYSDIVAYLMSSPYVKNLINKDMVINLEKKFKLSFTEDEKNIILNIIKISPNALLNVLEHLKSSYFYGFPRLHIKESKDEKRFLFNLQVLLGKDIEYMPFVSSKVEYRVTVSFKNDYKEDLEGNILQRTAENRIWSSLSPISQKKALEWIYISTSNSPL